jgi:hypothetical protein
MVACKCRPSAAREAASPKSVSWMLGIDPLGSCAPSSRRAVAGIFLFLNNFLYLSDMRVCKIRLRSGAHSQAN